MPKKTTTADPVEELSYEVAIAELEQVVTALEGEPASLDQAISLYERGQALVQRCSALLEKAEFHVKRLSGGELADLEED